MSTTPSETMCSVVVSIVTGPPIATEPFIRTSPESRYCGPSPVIASAQTSTTPMRRRVRVQPSNGAAGGPPPSPSCPTPPSSPGGWTADAPRHQDGSGGYEGVGGARRARAEQERVAFAAQPPAHRAHRPVGVGDLHRRHRLGDGAVLDVGLVVAEAVGERARRARRGVRHALGTEARPDVRRELPVGDARLVLPPAVLAAGRPHVEVDVRVVGVPGERRAHLGRRRRRHRRRPGRRGSEEAGADHDGPRRGTGCGLHRQGG